MPQSQGVAPHIMAFLEQATGALSMQQVCTQACTAQMPCVFPSPPPSLTQLYAYFGSLSSRSVVTIYYVQQLSCSCSWSVPMITMVVIHVRHQHNYSRMTVSRVVCTPLFLALQHQEISNFDGNWGGALNKNSDTRYITINQIFKYLANQFTAHVSTTHNSVHTQITVVTVKCVGANSNVLWCIENVKL